MVNFKKLGEPAGEAKPAPAEPPERKQSADATQGGGDLA
jgi:hypothetical protein